MAVCPALGVEELLPRAQRSGADAIILDLEAATAPAKRAEASDRLALVDLRPLRVPVFVRVNEVAAGPAERVERELRVAVDIGAVGVLLPRVMAPDDVRRAEQALRAAKRSRGSGELAIVPLIETAAAVIDAPAIGRASPRVISTRPGRRGECGHRRDEDARRSCPRVITRPPAWVCRQARLNPRQVAGIIEGFTPGPGEVERARAIVAAMEAAIDEGSGIAVRDGKMIDDPVARAARRTLARAADTRVTS